MQVNKNASTEILLQNKNNDEDLSSSEDETAYILNNIPRGRPKSGRVWKSVKTRAKSIIKTRGLQESVDKKLKLRKDLKYIKTLSRDIIEEKNKEKEKLRLRRAENIKRKEENEKKSEVVQVIKNPEKIKKMKRKHLRMLQKRDTLNL